MYILCAYVEAWVWLAIQLPQLKKRTHNNDRKFGCSNMHALLYGITWLHLLCGGGDRWMRFTRLISSTKYTMCAYVRVSLALRTTVCMHFFGGVLNSMLSTVLLCSLYTNTCEWKHKRLYTYIKLLNENSQVKFSRWGWPAIYVDTNGFFSIHFVKLLYILDKCVCVCVRGTHIDIVWVFHAMLSKIGIVDGDGNGSGCGLIQHILCTYFCCNDTHTRSLALSLALSHSFTHTIRINFVKGDSRS